MEIRATDCKGQSQLTAPLQRFERGQQRGLRWLRLMAPSLMRPHGEGREQTPVCYPLVNIMTCEHA